MFRNLVPETLEQRPSGRVVSHFPLTRVKTIMKSDPNVGPVTRDAAALMSFAAELFVHELTAYSWENALDRNTIVIKKTDVYEAARPRLQFDFLADIMPYWNFYETVSPIKPRAQTLCSSSPNITNLMEVEFAELCEKYAHNQMQYMGYRKY